MNCGNIFYTTGQNHDKAHRTYTWDSGPNFLNGLKVSICIGSKPCKRARTKGRGAWKENEWMNEKGQELKLHSHTQNVCFGKFKRLLYLCEKTISSFPCDPFDVHSSIVTTLILFVLLNTICSLSDSVDKIFDYFGC